MRSMLLMTMVLLSATQAKADSFLYVSLSGENKISLFKVDTKKGGLTHQKDFAADSSPGSLAVHPNKKYLFAALRSSGKLGAFRIDPENGNLTLINTVSANGSAAYVLTDRTGRFLFSAYYGQGKVAVHAIGKDGSLSEQPLQTIPTAEKAHAILIDSTNRFVYVPHTGPNAIFQFRFDAKTGKLSPNDVPRVNTPEGDQPRHLWFHPTRPFAYVDNEKGSSVTLFKRDSSSGTLSPLQTLSTLPVGYSDRNSCADIEVHPSGRFVYSSNRGHDSIAGFAIDKKNGTMTSLGQFSTEKTPRSFNIDPSGRFLFAAGQASGKLAAYRINKKSGKLKRLETYPVGKGPAWVQIVQIPE